MNRFHRSFADHADEPPPVAIAAEVAEPRPAADGRRRPVVLLVTCRSWLAPARLALELFEAGFAVRAACPPGHVLEKVGFVEAIRRLSPFNQLRSLERELETVWPDLIAPADDVAARLIHALHARAVKGGLAGQRLRGLVERSLGGSGGYERRYLRSWVAAAAEAQAAPGPRTLSIKTESELREGLADIGLPAVLKTDGSSGGEGVSVVRSLSEASREWRRLTRPPSLIWSLKRLIFNAEADRLADCLRRRPSVNLQAFVPGRPATAAAALWRGEVLACVCTEVIETLSPSGPATVVQIVRHPQMKDSVARLARGLALSGLCGFDFILDASGQAHLIEVNPRATPTAHLTDAEGRSPLRALCAAVRGDPVPVSEQQAGARVALFPQELIRDPKSGHFATAYHDVPAQCPALVRLGRRLAERRNRAPIPGAEASVHQSEIRSR